MSTPTRAGERPTISTAPPPLREDSLASGISLTRIDERTSADRRWELVSGRLTRMASPGLTAPGGIALAALLVSPGVLVDLARRGTFATPSAVAFVLAVVVAALAVRRRALGTVLVLPPLLFLAAVATLARFSGNNRGLREMVLDVGTTLAISAPVLFGATLLVLVVALARLLAERVRR